jgi:nitrite reductase/ring-hydroxylating ferredoxin subunit
MSTEPADQGVAWSDVGAVDEWPTEGGRVVRLGAKRLSVFHHAGGWYAIDDRCPHERIGLAAGRLHDGQVTCPGHGWRFRLADGSVTVGPPAARVTTRPVRERAGRVEVG